MVQASDIDSPVSEFNLERPHRGTMLSMTDAKSFLSVEKHTDIMKMMRDEQETL